MDSDCGLSPKINLNMILYIVSVVITIYGTHNIILQVIIITYHISLYNSSHKKTWDILLPMLAMFVFCVLWSIFFIILYGIDRKFPLFTTPPYMAFI